MINKFRKMNKAKGGFTHTPKFFGVTFAKAKGGFTLIETMVALTIITFAVLGPVSLASYSIKTSTSAKNNVIASFLAQDAMEYIKNWRDDNYFQGENWLKDLDGPCANASGCRVDTTLPWGNNNAIKNCPSTCPLLQYDGLSYNYSSGTNTIFRRRYIIAENVVGQEARISINISWKDKFGNHSFDLEDHIFNWHP